MYEFIAFKKLILLIAFARLQLWVSRNTVCMYTKVTENTFCTFDVLMKLENEAIRMIRPSCELNIIKF